MASLRFDKLHLQPFQTSRRSWHDHPPVPRSRGGFTSFHRHAPPSRRTSRPSAATPRPSGTPVLLTVLPPVASLRSDGQPRLTRPRHLPPPTRPALMASLRFSRTTPLRSRRAAPTRDPAARSSPTVPTGLLLPRHVHSHRIRRRRIRYRKSRALGGEPRPSQVVSALQAALQHAGRKACTAKDTAGDLTHGVDALGGRHGLTPTRVASPPSVEDAMAPQDRPSGVL